MKTICTIFLAVILLVGCDKPGAVETGLPKCVKDKIAELEKEPVTNPPSSIWQFEYNGKTVYYVPPYCCDFYGTVYDSDCRVICHPDGGITGQGDGQCPDFAKKATNKKLIWEDNR